MDSRDVDEQLAELAARRWTLYYFGGRAEPRAIGAAVLGADPVDRARLRRAFHELRERDRRVLWLVVVERRTRAEVAVLVALTPNALAALARRVREHLLARYTQRDSDTVSRQRHRRRAR